MRNHGAERAWRGLLRRRAKRNEYTSESGKLGQREQRTADEGRRCSDNRNPLFWGDDDAPLENATKRRSLRSASAKHRTSYIYASRGNVTEVMRGAGMRLEGGSAKKADASRGHLQ